MLHLDCLAVLLIACNIEVILADLFNVSLPSSFSGNDSNLIYSNFFGISMELSTVNLLIGEDVGSIPPQIVNYFSYVQIRAKSPLHIRIGGNSLDDSVFNSSQNAMIVSMGPPINTHNQPVSYGPVLYDVLAEVAKRIGGAEYITGLPLLLREQNDAPLIVSTAEQKLGSYLDAFLLGNEPDLYGPNGRRQSNYSVQDYFGEFSVVSEQINSSSQYGNLVTGPYLGGPTICCNWDLADILNQGFLTRFGTVLKYVNLQHYPQNNCFGSTGATIPYYSSHFNVVSHAKWQQDGIRASKAAGKPVLLGEFNTASCGGVPGVSDTFAATLWTVDYVLQLATVGYDGAYIHTREPGVTYNLFDPPSANEDNSDWTTLPAYYALLSATEAFGVAAQSGVYVVDLNLNNNSESSTVAGYVIYDGTTGVRNALVFLNYADGLGNTTTFSIPSDGKDTIFMRTLTSTSLSEKYNISWAGKTFQGVSDGIMVDSGIAIDQELPCDATCNFDVPSPGAVVIWFNSTLASIDTSNGHSRMDLVPDFFVYPVLALTSLVPLLF